MPYVNIHARVFVRKPYSVTPEGSVEFGAGATVYADIQHPTRARAYAVVSTGITVFNISNRAAPSVVGTVTAAAGLIGNQAIDGLAFDSTGRYLYATSGTTSLYTFDLGASFVNEDNPTLVDTEATLSTGNALHVLKVIGANLYVLADTVTNNSFQAYSLASPAAPSLTSTTAMTGHDLEAIAGNVNALGTDILYPAGDTTGKIIAVPIASPSFFVALQLPTIGGLQIRSQGIAFEPADDYMALLAYFGNGTIRHYFWLIYDVSLDYSTANALCVSETIYGGAIANLRSPFICSSPRHAEFRGYAWVDVNDLYMPHLAVMIHDDSFAETSELRFYAWGAPSQVLRFARIPRPSGAVSIPGAYSVRARNEGATKTQWMHVGLSADRSNAILALATSDLPVLNDDYAANWFELADVLNDPGVKLEYGISGASPGDRVADTGTLGFELDNSEINSASNLGGYSPDAASPITEHLQIGSAVVLTIDPYGADEVAFYGIVARIEPMPGRWEERRVRVTCVDGIDVLVNTNVERLPLRSNISTAEALLTLWDRVPYLPGVEQVFPDRDEHRHELVFDRAYDEKTKLIGEITKLMSASRGYFFSRHYGARGLIHQSLESYKSGSLGFAGVAPILTDSHLREMELERHTGNISNSVAVRYYPRRVDAAVVVLATMPARVRILPGETVQIELGYRDAGSLTSRVGGSDMVFPVITTDYTMFANQGGGGSNLSSQVGVSAEFGATSALVVASNAGPGAGWFKTQLRGKGVYTQEPLEVTLRDIDSITRYQLRELHVDALYATNREQALAIASAYLEAHKSPRSFIRRVGFTLDTDPVKKGALMGPTRKIGIQEELTGLVGNDHWVLGTGKLNDAAGADAANLYGLDVYSVQKMALSIGSLGITKVLLDTIPEEMAFREPWWLTPKADWSSGDALTKTLLNLFLRDCPNSLFRVVNRQSADVAKTDTTFSDLTGLTLSMKAGETWSFFVLSFFISNLTADVKYTAIVADVNGNVNAALAHGGFALVAEGAPVTSGYESTWGNTINYAVTNSIETAAVIHGSVVAVADCTLKIQGAQRAVTGTTTFRTDSFLLGIRHKGGFGAHSGITGWTDPKTWAAGENVTAALLNSYLRDNFDFLYQVVQVQTADVTKTSNTTLGNLTGLAFAVLSGEHWIFLVLSMTDGGTVADLKYTVLAPTGTTGRFGLVSSGFPLAAGSSATYGNAIDCAASDTQTNALVGGYLIAGADGVVEIQGAQNTSSATPTVFRQGSPMIAIRVSGGGQPTFAANDVLTAANLQAYISDALNGRHHTGALQTENLRKNQDVTTEDIAGMRYDVKAGETWVFLLGIVFLSQASADVKFAITGPADSGFMAGALHSGITSASWSDALGSGIFLEVLGSTRDSLLIMGSVIVVNDGTLQLQGAQAVSQALDTDVLQDSWLRAWRKA